MIVRDALRAQVREHGVDVLLRGLDFLLMFEVRSRFLGLNQRHVEKLRSPLPRGPDVFELTGAGKDRC